MTEIKFEIIKKIGVLSKSASGWAKELDPIGWNEKKGNMILLTHLTQ